jgi:allophanate hydrolase
MTALLAPGDARHVEVVARGALTSVQDLGRRGARRLGVPTSGALDPTSLRIANALAGNAEGAPALEFFLVAPTLRAGGGPVRVGVAGDAEVEVFVGGRRARCGSWRSVLLHPGEALRVRCASWTRVGYLAFSGGLAVDPVMGSASTYLRGGFGGLAGAPLQAGQRLALGAPCDAAGPDVTLRDAPPPDPAPIVLAVPGPQDDHFTAGAIERFFSAEYAVRPESDRMGMRLDGPPLAHRRGRGPDITSDATVPGSVQVPGDGRPIVLLADCQTTGGYAKIATVASAEVARLARLPPGARVRFQRATRTEAEDLARERERVVAGRIAGIAPLG